MSQETAVDKGSEEKKYREEFATRLTELINNLNVSIYQFQKSIGARSRTIYNVFDGRSVPGSYMLCLIKRRYRKLNMDWLLTGTGPMWLSERGANMVTEPDSEYGKTVMELQEENNKLKDQVIKYQSKYSDCLEKLNDKESE